MPTEKDVSSNEREINIRRRLTMVCRQVCVGWVALSAVAVTLVLGVPTSSRTRDDRATSWQRKHKYDPQGTLQENNTQNEAAMAEVSSTYYT